MDLHQYFGARKVWEKYNVTKSPTISITDIWASHGQTQSASVVESRAISSFDLENWLNETARKFILTEDHSRIVRVVWVGRDSTNHRDGPSSRDLGQVLSAWDLQDAYEYAMSCFAGVSALPVLADKEATTECFTATYHPKLAFAWSHTTNHDDPVQTTQTQIVVFAEGQERAELLSALQSKWNPSLLAHPMFPALICSLTLSKGLDTTLEDIKTVVRNVEARTGHHRFTSTRRQTSPAAGELGSLSAEMSGCAAKLASGARKLKVIEALNDFILKAGRPASGSVSNSSESSSSVTTITMTTTTNTNTNATTTTPLSTHIPVALLTHRSKMQGVDMACVQQRVQIQIAALFHLIAQQDNAIAFETASATRSIAKDSLQDSSAMKMLALVTMFFLPGSFVATLFSAPLFDWTVGGRGGGVDGSGSGSGSGGLAPGTRPQFALFWIVTVPLTVVTFSLYAGWMVMQRKRLKRRLTPAGSA